MKKIIAIILSAVLICTCFVGCADKNDTSTPDANATDTNASALEFTFDTYYSAYDDSTIHYYEQMCQAINDQQSELRFNQSIYENVSQLLFTSFPLVDLIVNVSINNDMSGITNTYKYDNAQHTQLVNEFANKIDEIKSDCMYTKVSDNEYIINVYKYIASNIVFSQNKAITLYETITTNQGTSFTYSRMFEYILQQSGIDTSHVIALDKAQGTCGLSIVFMDNSYFYFDPIREFTDNGGTKLKFFGMTTADAVNCGLSDFSFSDSTKITIEIIDPRFAPCRNCESYSVSNDVLTVVDAQSQTNEISLIIENDASIVG